MCGEIHDGVLDNNGNTEKRKLKGREMLQYLFKQ